MDHLTALFAAERICVVGNINRDVKIAPIESGAYLFSDGETSTAFVRETFGGGGANSALAAAALGADVAFVGKVGADAWGSRLDERLAACGVRGYLARDERHPTGTSVNLVYSSGHRHFVSCLPSSRAFSFEDIDPAALTGAHHLLRADIWFSEAMLFGGNEKLFAVARRKGIATSLDLNWDPEWNAAPAEVIEKRIAAVRSVLPLTDLVHGNVSELTRFTGTTQILDALRQLTRWGAKAAVVHLGRNGAGYWTGTELIQQPAELCATPVHATGSGDVLSVCMLLLHRSDMPIREKLRAANQLVSAYMSGQRTLIPQLEPPADAPKY